MFVHFKTSVFLTIDIIRHAWFVPIIIASGKCINSISNGIMLSMPLKICKLVRNCFY